MKKIALITLALMMLLTAIPALAQTVSNGAYQITLPDDAELYTEDAEEGEVAYYTCDTYEVGLYQYDAEGMDLTTYVETWGKENNAEQTGTVTLNGINAGYYLFANSDDQGDFYMIVYTIIEDDVAYEFAFIVDKDDNLADNSAKTAAVMETLARE